MPVLAWDAADCGTASSRGAAEQAFRPSCNINEAMKHLRATQAANFPSTCGVCVSSNPGPVYPHNNVMDFVGPPPKKRGPGALRTISYLSRYRANVPDAGAIIPEMCGRCACSVKAGGGVSKELTVDYLEGEAMLVGYARNSGASQSFEFQLQLRSLSDAGCAKIFSEQEGGAPTGARGALQGALDFVRHGDTLVVIQLDRLARSPNDIHGIIASLAGSGVSVRCLQPPRVDPDKGEIAQLAMLDAVAA